MSTLQTRKRAQSPSHCLEVSRLTGGADTGPGVPDVRCPPQLCSLCRLSGRTGKRGKGSAPTMPTRGSSPSRGREVARGGRNPQVSSALCGSSLDTSPGPSDLQVSSNGLCAEQGFEERTQSALQRTSPGLRTWPPSPTDGKNERPHRNLQSLGSRRSLGALYTREITSFPQNTRRQVLLPSSSFKMHKPGLSEVADVPEVTHVESAGTGI